MLLGVAGMVGTGKTTLTRALARYFGFAMELESVSDDLGADSARSDVSGRPHVREGNPWLPLFYGEPGGMARYGLHLQLHFLATRMESLRRIRAEGGDWILDRTWYEDAEIFARGLYERELMSALDFELYRRLYTELCHGPAARPPRLLIYLHGPLDHIVLRIQTRGREAERDAPLAYWESLHERYARWIRAFRYCPILPLDIREFDLVEDEAALEWVAGRVRRTLGKDLARAGEQYRLPLPSPTQGRVAS